MTMLGATQSEGYSYLDIAQILQAQGDSQYMQNDLEQLFRRVVFNVMVGNRDDHLRNHGFVMSKNGWRLSAAFDVNPNIDKAVHVLRLDDKDNRPSIHTVINTASFYDLSKERAGEIVTNLGDTIKTWRRGAQKMGISRADIQLMSSAFWDFEG